MIRRFVLAAALLLTTQAKADTYEWRCEIQQYCDFRGCWYRQYCCHQLCNPAGCWWECVWR